jgi:hypothetical protein
LVSVAEAVVTEFLSKLSGLTVYEGTVPDKPTFPYVLALSGFTGPVERSITRSPQSRAFRAQTTCVGLTAASVRIVADRVRRSLEGARLQGVRLEEVPNGQPVLEDRDVTDTGTGLHPLYQPLEWRAVLSP